MAAASPIKLEQRAGRAEIVDATAFRPPVPVDPVLFRATLEGVHATAITLVDELKHGANVDERLLRRVARYAQAADPARDPSLALLESAMVLLRPIVTDDYSRAAMDVGLTGGLEHLVNLHDSLGAPSATPDPLPPVPHVPDTPDAARQAAETIQQVADAVKEAAENQLVGDTVVVAVNSTVDIANSANAPLPPASPDEAKQRQGWWSWALRMGGGLARALDVYGKAHNWANSPAGRSLLLKVSALIALLRPFFS